MKKISLAVVCAAIALMFAAPRRSLPVPNPSRGALAFRVTFGEKRTGGKIYDGSVHTAGGRLLRLAPWRFFGADRVAGADSWKLEIKRGPMENQPGQPVFLAEGAVVPQNLVTAGILVTVEASTGSATFRTAGGTFTVPVAQLRYGRPLEFLDGDVRVERAPEVKQLSTEAGEQHDYPALAVTRSGEVWFAWQAYRDGGDHVYARAPNGALARLTENRADVFRPSIAEDAQGRIHVVWCERSGEEWHLVERVFSGKWSERARIPDAGTPNFYQRLAGSPGGRLHRIWVGHEAGESYLYTSSLRGRRLVTPDARRRTRRVAAGRRGGCAGHTPPGVGQLSERQLRYLLSQHQRRGRRREDRSGHHFSTVRSARFHRHRPRRPPLACLGRIRRQLGQGLEPRGREPRHHALRGPRHPGRGAQRRPLDAIG
jgi:hypothetical protein